MSNGPFAGGKICATGEYAGAGQQRKYPLHRSVPITFASIDGVDWFTVRAVGIAAKIKFKKANRGKNMMRSFVVSNHDNDAKRVPAVDDASPSLQASLLAV